MTKHTLEKPAPPAGLADEMRRLASSRSNCYGLLALVFRDAPTSEVVAQLRTPPLADALEHLGCDVAKDLAGELGVVTERLREEYTGTFVGPGPHVSPYGSVNHDGEGRLWGDSTVRVKRFIEATGLSFEGNWDSIPDHIAIELELMQWLAAHEAQLWAQSTQGPAHGREDALEGLRRCLQAQEEFLRDNVCTWVPQFCDRVREGSTSLFYRNMARLTKTMVLSELEQIGAARSTHRTKKGAY